jgi:hypothetical protein
LVKKIKNSSPGKNAKFVYIYSKDLQKLIFTSPSIIKLSRILKTSKTTIRNYIKSGECYLNSFVFRDEPLYNISLKGNCSSEPEFIELANQVYHENSYRAVNI